VELQTTNVDLRRVAGACLDLVRLTAEAKRLTVRLAIDPGVPCFVPTDATRLRQVLLNLLGNAVKYTSQGTVDLRLRTAAGDTELRFEVADTGPGISVEQRQKLFHEFERLNTDATNAVEGAGLGLFLSAKIAALMGWRLGHEDNPGGGSVFWLGLPLVASINAAPLPAIALAAEVSGAESALRPVCALHVLVVDDIAMNREIASSFLRVAGHEVTCVEGGAEAVAAVAINDFDVVVMDVRMPEIDGLEATRRIRALEGTRGQVPIIALTAQVFTEQVAECRKAGMDGHLAKPFDPDQLLAAVARATVARRTRKEGRCPVSMPTIEPDAPAIPVIGSELPVFDPKAFERTATSLTPEAVASYLRTIVEHGEALLCGLHGPDAHTRTQAELAEATHALVGSAGMFGFERLTATGRRFERAVQLGAPEEAPALAEALSAALEATLQVIHDRASVAVDA
jgi:CheY-like chemotaxis protein/HPt (histidine-containing phosphotransfer) domain-containing protein